MLNDRLKKLYKALIHCNEIHSAHMKNANNFLYHVQLYKRSSKQEQNFQRDIFAIICYLSLIYRYHLFRDM